MKRAFILLLDSFGIGASADADRYGDTGANTFGHIAAACANGQADIPGVRQGALKIPNLVRLGLAAAAQASYGLPAAGIPTTVPTAAYGYAKEVSLGKDTPSGHWEIAGVPVSFEWGYFPPTYPSFPDKLISDFVEQARLTGILGNKHASGTTIIDELGDLHIQTGQPIVYTSADSVFQIAAHEKAFGLERLYGICEIARKLVDEYNIGRVIARPFLGENGKYYRTANRRDYATPPPAPTLLDKIVKAGHQVIAIGKVADIFAHQGISQELHASNNMELFDVTLQATKTAPNHSLVFTNFVDFDSQYGHRRDIAGYAKALEDFDARLPEFEKLLQPGDLAIITADHGCDPSFPGSDHTREHIPVLAFGPALQAGFIGQRESFADIGQTIAKHLEVENLNAGIAFI